MQAAQQANFVRWFRAAAPYIHAFGGRTFKPDMSAGTTAFFLARCNVPGSCANARQ